MSANGWFPHLRADGVIASGNAGIWVTPLSGDPVQVSAVGTMPFWCGQQLGYNRNDNSTQVGTAVALQGYNEYVGCDGGQWAGFSTTGTGRIDRYDVGTGPKGFESVQFASIPSGCAPRFFGTRFGYLAPYLPASDMHRWLIVEGAKKAEGIILDWCADRAGGAYLYVVATGTYTKNVLDNKGNNVTIRGQQDETPQVCFTGPDGYPWMLSQTTNSGTFVRMIYSAFGYVIPGILDVPDARIIGSQLRVVGSDKGQPRHLWIDFAAPKVDLRLV